MEKVNKSTKSVEEINNELNSLDKEIESAKTESAQINGRLSESYSSLKDNYGVSDAAEGSKKLKELQSELQQVENQIQEKYAELKESYDW